MIPWTRWSMKFPTYGVNWHRFAEFATACVDKRVYGLLSLADSPLRQEITCEWGVLSTELFIYFRSAWVRLSQAYLLLGIKLLDGWFQYCLYCRKMYQLCVDYLHNLDSIFFSLQRLRNITKKLFIVLLQCFQLVLHFWDHLFPTSYLQNLDSYISCLLAYYFLNSFWLVSSTQICYSCLSTVCLAAGTTY